MNNKWITGGLSLFFIIFFAVGVAAFVLRPLVQIDAGHRGVVTIFGKVQPNVLGEGLHFLIPIVQKVHTMDVRVKKIEVQAEASSRDLQKVQTTVAVNYYLEENYVNRIYQKLGLNFIDNIVKPTLQEVLKAVFARFAAEESITKRQEVSALMKKLLETKLNSHHILVRDLLIVSFQFSQGYQEEVESKQIAEQRVKKAALDLQRIEIEKKQTITQAQAQGEALRLQRNEITADLVDLRKVEVLAEAVKKWDGKMPQVLGSGMPLFNLNNLNKDKKNSSNTKASLKKQ